MTRVVGVSTATLAVATPAQAFLIAGLVRLGSRRPVLVVTPTGAAAEQLAHDLEAFVGGTSGEDAADRDGLRSAAGAKKVEVFPAWETLPFERVSPDVATMGRRLQLLWQLAGARQSDGSAVDPGDQAPEIVVAPIKAVLQCLGPWQVAARPVVVAKKEQVSVELLVNQLVAMGYRRESLVEHRGELAVRGGIVDVFPSTSDQPIRIDLWGDEVDRLTRFDVADQRSIDDLERVDLFGCRELVADEAMRKKAAGLVGSAPWGRHQWDRLADGDQFDGMESWLPWLVESEELITDLLGDDSQVVLVEPRRIRDRAAELGDEESALADALATTWGLEAGEGTPRLHAPFDRLLAHTRSSVVSLVASADGPDVPSVESRGWEPILGDAARLTAQVTALVDDDYSVVLCSSTRAGADRLSGILAEEGAHVEVASAPLRVRLRLRNRSRPDARSGRARGSHRGGRVGSWFRPAPITGRRSHRVRRHRSPPPSPSGPGRGPARSTGSSTTSPPEATLSTASTEWPGTAAWSPAPWVVQPATTSSSSTGGPTSCTCPPTRSNC